MGVIVDIDLIPIDSGSHILYGVNNAVNQKLRSDGEQVQISGDGVIRLGNCAGVGKIVASGAGLAVAVACDGKGSQAHAAGGVFPFCLNHARPGVYIFVIRLIRLRSVNRKGGQQAGT